MCAVKFAVVGNDHDEFLEYNIEEKSYSPEGKILDGFDSERFAASQSFKHMAMVCGINNRSSLHYEDNTFKRRGEPTEAALKVFSEKLGQYDF